MADDVLRLRATVVSEEALAALRALRREIGLVPNAGRGIGQINKSFETLGGTIRNIGRELTSAIPALGGFGLGAAGAGLAAGLLFRQFSQVATKIVELKYQSKELGMSERDLRAWSTAAQKVGLAPESIMAGLKGFKQTTEEFKYNIGTTRNELIAMGAGPVIARINAATTTAGKLKEAFDFKNFLDKSDPSGYKSRKLFEMLGLGAENARLSLEQFNKEYASTKPLSAEDQARAKKFSDAVIDLGKAWDNFVIRAAVPIFPWLTGTLNAMTSMVEIIERGAAAMAPAPAGGTSRARGGASAGHIPFEGPMPPQRGARDPVIRYEGTTGPVPEPLPMPDAASPAAPAPYAPGSGRTRQGVPRGRQSSLSGFSNVSFGGFGGNVGFSGTGGGPMQEFTAAIKDGTFQALVEWTSYMQTGGAAGGGGGGFQNASFGGSGGAAAGAGVPSGANPFGGSRTSVGGDQAGNTAYEPGTGRAIGAGGPGVGGGSPGGSGGITAPAGTPIARTGLATVTAASGRKFQVDAKYAENFQGFINDYEKAGGVLGPDTGTLGSRPHNASGHPIGAAIDINQIGRGVRSGRAPQLDPKVEDALAEKWGLVSGNKWKSNDQGHFGIRSPSAAQAALEAQRKAAGVPNGQTPSDEAVRSKGAGAQTPFQIARAAAVEAGIPDPDTAAAIALHESGNMRRGTGSVFDKSGGTNPFGQTVKKGTPGAVRGRDNQDHAVYGSLAEGFAAHYKRWGDKYKDTPDETLKAMVAGNYNTVDPKWRAQILAIRERETAALKAREAAGNIDKAVSPQTNVNGSVAVNVTSNGTAAKTDVKNKGNLFQESKVKQHQQGKETETPAPKVGADLPM